MRKFIIALASVAVVVCGCSRTQSTLPIPIGNLQPTQDRLGIPPDSPPRQYTILHSFRGGDDGITPLGDLLQDSAGNLYGTTFLGGPGNCSVTGCGTIYKIDVSGKKTTLYRFHGGDGYGPMGGLIRDAAGNLYGTTGGGGASDYGIIFKLEPSGHLIVLYTFNGTNGKHPSSTLVQDAPGNFYGTTYDGGSSDDGVVFKL
ncbi:MAG TPA: choice-of-anchor tandem repeat GloVer-containing protein, partial [Candidatus Eremiobacteraceae bacterium]